jgi:hypothetical protein
MAIYTPRGLKIRIDIPTSFGLMARLYPDVSPKRILHTTEAIDATGSALGFFTAIICFSLHLSPEYITIFTLIAFMAGLLITELGIIICTFRQGIQYDFRVFFTNYCNCYRWFYLHRMARCIGIFYQQNCRLKHRVHSRYMGIQTLI